MGKAELAAAWQIVKTELDTLPDDYDKLDLLEMADEFIDAKSKEVDESLKSVDPTNISDVPSGLAKVLINKKWYNINTKTGELTPR